MLELGQLDLQLAFVGARPLGEDVEDQAHAIDDPAAELALEIALLGRRQLVIEDGEARAGGGQRTRHFLHLALAGEQCGIGARAPAAHLRAGVEARARRKLADFLHALRVAGLAEIEADQHRLGAVPRTVKHQLGKLASTVGALVELGG